MASLFLLLRYKKLKSKEVINNIYMLIVVIMAYLKYVFLQWVTYSVRNVNLSDSYVLVYFLENPMVIL